MPILHLILNTIRLRWAFSLCMLVMVFTSPALNIFSQPVRTGTQASLKISGTNLALVLSGFLITPPEIFPGENLIFTMDQVKFNDGSIASNLPCVITITTPDSSVVVLSGISNQLGICSYDTSLSLAAQGLTLVSGNLSKINNNVGAGSGFAKVTYGGAEYITNTTSYNVKPVIISLGEFRITPKIININGNLVFQITDIKLNNGTVGSNLPIALVVTTPDGSEVRISGKTNSNGAFVYDTSKTLAEQELTLVSGNLSNINQILGDGKANVEIVYNNNTYTSNVDSYKVSPNPPSVPEIIQNIVRTGGGVPMGIIVVAILGIMAYIVRVSLKKENN